ncbi:MAG: sulfatase, partial [Aggregatilineales bacterium]
MPPERPDILLIVLDTVRRDRLGAYGCARPNSPALDAFAADSTLFLQAVSPAQWTVPAHASLFTGLYPGAHGVTEASHKLSGLHPTLAETLRAAGYYTAGFSNNPLVGVLDNDLTRGFADFFVYAGAAVNRPLEKPGPLQRRWRRFAQPTQNRFAHSDALFRASLNALLVPLWTRFVNYKGDTAQSVTDLIDYLQRWRASGSGAPLFVFLNLMGAHLPYRPPRSALEAAAPELSRDRRAAAFVQRFNAQAVRWASPDEPPLRDWQRAALRAWYDAELRAQDAHLSRLLEHLATSGALDNTLVVIAADHGEGHGDHGYIGHSFVVYQELVHVPLLVRWPGGAGRGTRVAQPVSTRRIYHTALEAAGVIPPLDAADPNAN